MTDVLDRVLWWDQLPDELREPIGVRLDRDTETDVAIIGAGYTGLWTAYYLQRTVPGLRITV
ncbi:MAG: FAD-dependent oxidoreductase, partial [Candidatus Nanopelagicales bacterium]